MNLDVESQVNNVFITGASAGLGRALAERYLTMGCRVAGISRRNPQPLVDAGMRFESVDLSDLASIEAPVKRVLADAESLSTLILNAAELGRFGHLYDLSLDEMKRSMDVNLWANKVVLEAVFDVTERVDQVLVITTGASKRPKRGMSGYCISKSASNMLTALWAQELPGTHFTLVDPGPIKTAMQDILCSIRPDPDFPVLASLRSRRDADQLQDADDLAAKLVHDAVGWRDLPSGSFVDLRLTDSHQPHIRTGNRESGARDTRS